MLQVRSFVPGFLLGLVTVAVLAVSPARGPEPGTGATGEAAGELAAIPASQEDVDSVGVSTNSAPAKRTSSGRAPIASWLNCRASITRSASRR